MSCRTCTRTNLHREDFLVMRDGKWLMLARCRHCTSAEDKQHNREQRAKGK